jgi:hypothetical protein
MIDTCNWGVDTYALRAVAGRVKPGWLAKAIRDLKSRPRFSA